MFLKNMTAMNFDAMALFQNSQRSTTPASSPRGASYTPQVHQESTAPVNAATTKQVFYSAQGNSFSSSPRNDTSARAGYSPRVMFTPTNDHDNSATALRSSSIDSAVPSSQQTVAARSIGTDGKTVLYHRPGVVPPTTSQSLSGKQSSARKASSPSPNRLANSDEYRKQILELKAQRSAPFGSSNTEPMPRSKVPIPAPVNTSQR